MLQSTAVRAWAVVDVLLSSGLREAECAALRVGDLRLGYGEAAIYVSNGKGSKSRTVLIPNDLKAHLKRYVRWKADHMESIDESAPLFIGQRGQLKPSGVAECVKSVLRKCGLYRPGMSAHSLRHSFAMGFYRMTRDLRALQQQLGHSSSQTTEIYAHVLDDDIRDQLEKGIW